VLLEVDHDFMDTVRDYLDTDPKRIFLRDERNRRLAERVREEFRNQEKPHPSEWKRKKFSVSVVAHGWHRSPNQPFSAQNKLVNLTLNTPKDSGISLYTVLPAVQDELNSRYRLWIHEYQC